MVRKTSTDLGMDATHCSTQSTGLRGTAPGSVSTSWHGHKERAKYRRDTHTKGAGGRGGFGFHTSLTSHSCSFLKKRKGSHKHPVSDGRRRRGNRGESASVRKKGLCGVTRYSSHDHDGGVAPTQGHGRPLGPHADLRVVRFGRVQGQRWPTWGEDSVES